MPNMVASFRFVDDVRFYFDEARHEIHFRSASRIGFGDLNANPRRMAAIRAAFTKHDAALHCSVNHIF